MKLPELTFLHFLAAGAVLYVLWTGLQMALRFWRRIKAYRHMRRYNTDRDAYYTANPARSEPIANRHGTPQRQEEDYIKDKDTKVQDVAEPKGFWTRFVMNQKIGIIREMIRISNSDQHKGYWQDRIEAQKRVEGARQIGDDAGGQGR